LLKPILVGLPMAGNDVKNRHITLKKYDGRVVAEIDEQEDRKDLYREPRGR